MTDFARLGIEIDSTQAKGAAGDLDRLAVAGARAEAATIGIGRGSKAAGVAAASMAAQAQLASRAAVGMAGGANTASLAMQSLGTKSRASSIQIRESLVLMREASVGNFTRMAGSASILAGSLATTGSNVGALAKQLLTMVGILKVTQDAELAEAATQAAVSAAAVEAYAQRAAGAIAAADTELALAEAAVRVATTSEAEAAAQAELAAAHEAVATAAAQAVIAEDALAVAQGRAAETAAASAAATKVGLGATSAALAGVAVVAGVAFGAFKRFQDQVKDSGELDKYAEGLRLTDEQIKKAGGSVKYLSDRTREVTGLTVTFGDVMHGVFQEIGKEAKSDAWGNMKKSASSAFSGILDFWNKTSAGISAGLWTLGDIAKDVFQYIGQKIGESFYNGVNKAIDALNSLNASLPKWAGGGDADLIPHLKADKAVADLKSLGATIQKQAEKNYADALAANNAAFAGIEKGALDHRKKMLQIESDSNKPPKPPKDKKVSDHGLAEALAELDAQIRGQNALAAAYQVSDAAAIKAEAMQKAEEQAIRHKGEVGIFYEKELALAVATRAADGAKQIADIHAEAAARSVVNDLVEQGIIPVQRMGEALDEQTKKRQLMAALAVAEDKGWLKQAADLRDEIANLAFVQGVLNDEIAKEAALRQIASNNDQITQLKKEIELVGASNRARAEGLAILQAEQFIRDNNITDEKDKSDVTKSYVDAANAATTLTEAQNNYNNSLSHMADLLGLINEQAQLTASALSNAFGNVGAGIGTALTAMTNYAAVQAKLDQEHHAATLAAGTDAKALADVEILYAQKSANARDQAALSVIGGLKSLFKEHSAGYKVMTAIEKAYAILQLVNTVKSIALDTAKTGSSIANSAARAAADGVAAIAKAIASLPFPLNIAAGAATAAALIAFGVKVFGGGGGGGGKAPTSAEDIQAAQGTGTVLGSANAQSESISHSLELVAANTNKSLEYFNPMLQSLRAIETNIGALAAQVAKELQLGGAFDTTGKLGTTSKGIQGLFGSTTTKSLYDQGLQFDPTALSSAIANGISGSTYQIIEKVKKSSGFLGLGGGTKTSYSTTTGSLDPDLERQVGLILGSLRDSVVQAAKVLGIDVSAALNTFQVEIGKISFKDMSADEISKALEAVFSKVADQMAGFAVAGLEQFQKAGEGLFETLTRLAKDYTTIDVALKSIGKTFGSVGAASIAARENLIALFGSLQNFVDETTFYQQNFLTDAQSIAPIEAQVKSTLASLGLSSVDTIDKFNKVVQGIDLTTDAGQQLYASLMALAPAFYQVEQYQAQQAAAAAALAKQKSQMEITLLQAQGKATEALAKQRAMELAALDPSLRALQQQIYTAQDIAAAKDKLSQAYQRERSELEATISKFGDLSKSLREYRDTLFGGPTGGATYNSALAKLIATGSLASTGDATALGDLQGVSKTFLDVAKDRAGSLQQYQRDVALVARYVDQGITASDGQVSLAQKQLDTMTAQVSKLIDINASVLSVKDAILALNALIKPAPTPPPATTQGGGTHTGTGRQGGFQGSFSDRIDELIAISRQMATSTSRTDRTLRSWDRGGSQAVSTDSDTPLATTPA